MFLAWLCRGRREPRCRPVRSTSGFYILEPQAWMAQGQPRWPDVVGSRPDREHMATSGQAHGDTHRVGLGIVAALAGMLCLTLNDALGKLLGGGYSVAQIVLIRGVLGLGPILLVVRQGGGWRALTVRSPGLHVLRIACATGSAYLFFAGLVRLPLTECLAITFAGPILITALSGPILGERVGARRWAVVLVGFVGVMLMLRPGTAMFQLAALLPLGATVCYALLMVLTRVLSRTDGNAAILFWSNLGLVVVSVPFTVTTWVSPVLIDWGVFLLLGISGAAAMYWLIVAYRHAPAAVVAPIDYTTLPWGMLFGWVLWRETPDPAMWPGVAVMVAAGLYLIRHEARPAGS
jgi:drug/metabolite transporter (DMT)-like permease